MLFRQNILIHEPSSEEKERRPTYDGVELVAGWKVVGTETIMVNQGKGKQPQKKVLTNWEERPVAESFQHVSAFASDLSASLNSCVQLCITSAAVMSDFFDIEETFVRLCGERLDSGRIKIKEGELEEHGAKEFKLFFKEMCAINHIVELNDERFDERMHASVLHEWKACLKYFVWDKEMMANLLACLVPDGNNALLQLKADVDTSLMKMELVPKKRQEMTTKKVFIFEFANHTPYKASVNEEEVIRMMYKKEALFQRAGQVAMTAFDIAMSMGGSEAIVESFYSVMDTQR